MSDTVHIDSISQIHEALGLDKPKHPLVTVVRAEEIKTDATAFRDVRIVMNLFQVAFKQGSCGTIRYGRNSYDYEEGTLIFTAPGQVMEFGNEDETSSENPVGWTLVFHPDLLQKSELADKIDGYSFFNYEANEALHLSDDEKKTIEELLDKIIREYGQNLDKHSQHLIVSNIQLLLDYCVRFYDRQFYTRTNLNSDVVAGFERFIKTYYAKNLVSDFGLPTVHYCAKELNFSANYLSDLLKKETGKTAQEHIHLYIIKKAKTSLLNSEDSISQIGYALGFEYPQHFSNLFKAKTGMSPKEFRHLN